MQLLSKDNEPLATVTLTGDKGQPLQAQMQVGDTVITSPGIDVSIGKAQDGLEASMRIPGLVNFKIMLEKDDVKALKGLMNKDALGFLMKAMF